MPIYQPGCMPRSPAPYSRVVGNEHDVDHADLDDFDAIDTACRELFAPGRYPAPTTTESRRRFGGSRVEITRMVQRRSPATAGR